MKYIRLFSIVGLITGAILLAQQEPPAHAFYGIVTYNHGLPAVGCSVRLCYKGSGGYTEYDVTDSQGNYSIDVADSDFPEGTYDLWAWKNVPLGKWQALEVVEVDPDTNNTREVDLHMTLQ